MQLNSLRFQLSFGVALLLLISIASMALIGWQSTRSSNQNAIDRLDASMRATAETILTDAARVNALDTASVMNRNYDVAKNLASLMRHSAVGSGNTPYSREQVQLLASHLLLANPSVSSIYTQYEPNGYDGKDSDYQGSGIEHSSDQGTLEVYWVASEAGIEFIRTADASDKYLSNLNEFGIREAEWYLCSRDRGRPCLMEPYQYEIRPGYEVLLTSLVYPVMVNGTFRGVAGVDINLPVLQESLLNQATALYDGKADLYLLSDKQLVVASNRFANQLGQSLQQLDPALATALQQQGSGLFSYQDQLVLAYPIPIEASGSTWYTLVAVPEQVALATARELSAQLQEDANATTARMLLSGLGLLLFFVSLMSLWLARATKPIVKMSLLMQELAGAEGDLTRTLDSSRHQELQDMAHGFNAFTAKLALMIKALQQFSAQLQQQTHTLVDTSQHTNQATQLQAAEIQNVVSAMHEMTATANEVAQLAGSTAEGAQNAILALNEANGLFQSTLDEFRQLAVEVEQSKTQIEGVAGSSQEINQIIEVIQSIAEQTNLLALNAAIEAARAGEQGRGFAVVADEVRTLAARTHSSTDQIKQLITNLQHQVSGAVQQISKNTAGIEQTLSEAVVAYDKLSAATGDITAIADNSFQVATAAEEQNQVSDEINRNISAIGDATRELEELAQRNKDVSDAIDAITQQMDNRLNQLKC
ncbi:MULTISPECIES: methyl-accepting chemotaxis protein [Alkalimonas]|uniref:Methyl-accepting chemotaxis protein n=1 Tax=Alkalimonas mucilaginosa TaxID=3057676 RepID=A0ABU7JB92_9GAMM|nr:methyl-accepting chemotaxis protein [Alkalimonas sp. MEB004]MEE2022954.1 methyl-accepting chemotaxis protein [Alkalimonas sp. MEB004]